MSNPSELPSTPSESPFEAIKRIDSDGNEFWAARDLMLALDYSTWQAFQKVLTKARRACENSGQSPDVHFKRATKIITVVSNTPREIEDVYLSRYACSLIIQNASPLKPEVALGQAYFGAANQPQER